MLASERSILTGIEVISRLIEGSIVITPLIAAEQIGSTSVDVRLGPEIWSPRLLARERTEEMQAARAFRVCGLVNQVGKADKRFKGGYVTLRIRQASPNAWKVLGLKIKVEA